MSNVDSLPDIKTKKQKLINDAIAQMKIKNLTISKIIEYTTDVLKHGECLILWYNTEDESTHLSILSLLTNEIINQ